ncbi:MAG: serine/threonine-protein kinase [bacterium]
MIHELIGVGGMAQVYRASVVGPEDFEKQVVIKRVKSDYQADHSFIQMFIDEAKLSATLDHPNIVSVFDFGETDGRHYLAMEYIDGLNLYEVDRRHWKLHDKPVPWQAVALIGRDMLRGLDYAHHQTDPHGEPLGLIHRDVSPVNVLIRQDGTVKLVDFGIAKADSRFRGTQTAAGVVKGKIPYLSPEQADGESLDGRSDVFAAAIIQHELLTGKRLFHGKDDLESLHLVKSLVIPELTDVVQELPPELSRVVRKGLSRDLEARYSSAGAMADALEEIIYEHRVRSTLLAEVMQILALAADIDPPDVVREKQRVTREAWFADAHAGSSRHTAVTSGQILASGSIESPSGEENLAQTLVYRKKTPDEEVTAVETPGSPVVARSVKEEG